MAITIKEVARLAGVSTASVSRVINQHPSVKPKTVEKVNKAIAESGFVPNLVARNLKNEQSRIVGLIVSDISNSYFMEIAKVLEKELQQYDYDLFICNTGEIPEQEAAYLYRMISNRASGIVLNTTGYNEKLVAEISQKIPVVLLDRAVSDSEFKGDFVSTDGRDGVFRLTKELIAQGHEKIGFIGGTTAFSSGNHRYIGFQQAMATIDQTVKEDYLYNFQTALFNEESGFKGAKKLLGLSVPPTAIVVANNEMAIGALKYFRKQQIKLPSDVALAIFGNIENSELLFIEPTHASQNPIAIGEKTAAFLLSRMTNEMNVNREAIFESQIYLGSSS